ncbi:MAG: cytochrome c peroxidase [Sediminibacterium sp.]|nr:cytochrome c peroxidase [Sediminibacterium sp.]TXT33526.1 MAG: cytochrome c peroxidase [Chitinophagaceae bacterium]
MKKWIFLAALIILAGIGISFTTNPSIKTREALGEKLFHEKILSKDSSISCASCHIPSLGFADSLTLSIGIHGTPTTRNTPSVLNMKNRPYYFWDGRAGTLAQQSLMPIANKDEMGLPITEAVQRLRANPTYQLLFRKIFGSQPTAQNLSQAIAAYENTLETDDSKFDLATDDTDTLTSSEERGRKLFVGEKAKCFDCHMGPDFTNDDFKNIGLFDGKQLTDKGRFTITKQAADLGKFKTPGLRNIAITAPYMHNGMFKTLEEVVDYYNNPEKFVRNPINIDSTLSKPLGLTEAEKADLVNFLKTLTDKRFTQSPF